jgi:peptide deformylase
VRGWQAVVARPRTVRLTGQDETGRELDEVVTGWPARIVQHETDHLGGTLYVDRAVMRSLVADSGIGGALAAEPSPATAARVLGFPTA